jgi:hypothetical protein
MPPASPVLNAIRLAQGNSSDPWAAFPTVPDTEDGPGGDDLQTTLNRAQQALKLGTNRLDDPRIESPSATTKSRTPSQDDYSDFIPVHSQDDYSGFEVVNDQWSAFPTVGEPVHESQGMATNFADQGDLRRYQQAKANGASEEEALQIGDNGVGADELGGIKTANVYGAALPEEVLRQSLGDDPAAWRRARAEVWMNGQKRLVPIVDKGPGQAAQARGVTTDLTAPLSNGLGGSGMDPVTTRIYPEAGPDYVANPKDWWDEQHKIAASMPGAKGFDQFPVADEPEAPGASYDYSAFESVDADDGSGNQKAIDLQNRARAAGAGNPTGGPKAPQAPSKPDTGNPWDIGKAWQNLFASGSESSSTLDANAALDDLNRAKTGIGRGGLFEPIRKAQDDEILNDPNTPQSQKDQILQGRQAQLSAEQAAAQSEYDRKTLAAKVSAAAAPGEDYQKTIPGIITKFVGQNAPFLASGILGPLAPAAVGIQMSESAYGENFERDFAKTKAMHPDWTDDQVRATADKTAREASQFAFETGIVAGLLPVPKAGPLIARMVERVGVRGAYMTIAGASQDIQDNLAIRKNIDPGQAIYDGVLAHAPANFAQGAAFEIPGAIGEAFGRPGAVPDRAQEASDATDHGETPPQAPEEQQQPQAQPERQPQPNSPAELEPADNQAEIDSIERDNQAKYENLENGQRGQTETQTPEQSPPPNENESAPNEQEQPIEQTAVDRKLELLGLDNNRITRAIATLALRKDGDGQERMVVSAGKAPDGSIVTSEYGHGTIADKYARQGGSPDDLRMGFLTNKGRFVSGPEGVNLGGEARDIKESALEQRRQASSPISQAIDQLRPSERSANLERDSGGLQSADPEARFPEGARTADFLSPGLRQEPAKGHLQTAGESNERAETPVPPSGDARTFDELVPDEQQAFKRQVVEGLKASYQKVQPLLERLGVTAQENPRIGSVGIGAHPDGRLTFDLNPDGLIRSRWDLHRAKIDWNSPAHWDAVMEEELIHAAHSSVQRDEWVRSNRGEDHFGQQLPFNDYQDAWDNEVWSQTLEAERKARAAGNDRLADEFRDALDSSAKAYDLHGGGRGLERVGTDYEARALASAELVRQIVQIRRGHPMTEMFHVAGDLLRFVQDWMQQAWEKLKNVAEQIGHQASPWAKTFLAHTVERVEQRLADLENPSATFRTESLGNDQYRDGTVREAPRVQTRPGQKVGKGRQAVEELGTLAGRLFKGGESFFLDYHETKPLSLAEHQRVQNSQTIAVRTGVRELEKALKAVGNFKGFTKEFAAYMNHVQRGLTGNPPSVGPKTRAVIDAWRNFADKTGDEALRLKVRVQQSDGKIRPLRKIGGDYYPRMLSPDTYDIFENRDGSRAADFDELVRQYNASARQPLTRDEFIDKFIRTHVAETTTNEHFSNLAKAREMELPLSFYDFSPETMGRYMQRAIARLGQIETYGQRIGGARDVFDIAKDRVTKSTNLSPGQKKLIIDRISADQRDEYSKDWSSPVPQLMSKVQGVASGMMLGNPLTAGYNLISHTAKALQYGGPTSFTRTAVRFLNTSLLLRDIEEAHERQILRGTLRNILSDIGIAESPLHAKLTAKALKWSGFDAADSFTRIIGMAQAKYILADLAKMHGIRNDVAAREMYDMINRRMGRDVLGALAKESGKGPLTDEFIRQYVNDVMGTYHYSQSPSWMDSPTWRVLTQFMKWGVNTTRMMSREYAMPLARAFAQRDAGAIGYNLVRSSGFIAAAIGTGLAQQFYRQVIFGRSPNDPTMEEIGNLLNRGDSDLAVHWAMNRALSAIAMSGLSGTLGDFAQWWPHLMGQPTQRFHDPFAPPILGLFTPFAGLIQGWNGENGFHGPPSKQLIDKFLGSISSQYRTVEQSATRLAQVSGLKWDQAQQAAAYNDLSFLRSRIKMFADDNPTYRAKIERMGTSQAAMSGRGQFAPYKDDLEAALLTGNTHQAAATIRAWLNRFPAAEREKQLQSVRASVEASNPIRVAGSASIQTRNDFLRWARAKLPADEVRQFQLLSTTYSRTARAAGLNIP